MGGPRRPEELRVVYFYLPSRRPECGTRKRRNFHDLTSILKTKHFEDFPEAEAILALFNRTISDSLI